LAIAGGVFVAYHKPNFIPKNGVNVTDDSSELNEQRMALDGTCEATEEMYKKTENKETEFKEADTVVENDAVETEDAVEEDKDENDVVTASPEEVSDDEECQDHHEKCEEWASIGECKTNPAYMLSKKGCRKSCLVCGTIEIDLGMEQSLGKGEMAEQIQQRLQAAKEYMLNDFGKDPKKKRLLSLCKNKHRNCALWAVQGECENNERYMKTNCAPVCHTCDQLDMSARCPIDVEKMPNAWKPGDVNRFFHNLTTFPEYQQYEPNVLSSPESTGGPWVVVLDNVMSQEEAQTIIDMGTKLGYEQSYAGGKLLADGTYERGYSNVRTSSNTWCEHECYKDPIIKGVIDRITNITQIPEENSEFLQLLKYQEGEFYKTHHDYLNFGLERQCGVRLMTVFLYLNEVEEGGGTEFPKLGLTVYPKRGRALIWPSVKDEDPDQPDPRTDHGALPVLKGVKYGANAWIHQRDFKNPFKRGCN
jgi:prolyl 4-hydroxylase